MDEGIGQSSPYFAFGAQRRSSSSTVPAVQTSGPGTGCVSIESPGPSVLFGGERWGREGLGFGGLVCGHATFGKNLGFGLQSGIMEGTAGLYPGLAANVPSDSPGGFDVVGGSPGQGAGLLPRGSQGPNGSFDGGYTDFDRRIRQYA